MKTVTMRSYYESTHAPSRYPNSASRVYILHKLLDAALAAAITVAVVVIGIFLLVL